MKTLICIVLLFGALIFGITRGEFVGFMVDMYESAKGEIVVTDCPFVDSNDFPQACKAWAVGITAGTSPTTFSPFDMTKPYQAFLFIGKTLYAIER